MYSSFDFMLGKSPILWVPVLNDSLVLHEVFSDLLRRSADYLDKLSCVDASVDTQELSPESREGKMRAMPVLV
jgi:hypothetical protein